MIYATTLERTRPRAMGHAGTIWGRVAVLAGLVFSDLACFTLADLVAYLQGVPPRLSLFQTSAGTPVMFLDMLAPIAVLFVLARYVIGDYSRRQLFWDSARSTTNGLLIAAVPYFLVAAVAVPKLLPLLLLSWVGLLFLLPMARQGVRYVLAELGLWRLPTALLGASGAAVEVYPALARQLSLGFDFRWVVPESANRQIPQGLSGLKALFTTPDELARTLVGAGCRQVILVPDDQAQFAHNDLIDQLVGADMRVAIVPSLRRLPLFGVTSSYFFGRDLLLLQVRNNLVRLPQRALKRAIDIVGTIAALLLLWPLLLAFALLIRLEDGGPVFFVQTRVGRGSRDFHCWKFRTMVVDAEAQIRRWRDENPALHAQYREGNFKLRCDPRVTRIGGWLRRASLDELPQLFNVLLGEMSLVGPRPLLRNELPDYGAVISLYERVRPGITGLWQVSGRSQTTFAERVSYDEWYIKNWAVWYDAVIILQTVWVMLLRKGAY